MNRSARPAEESSVKLSSLLLVALLAGVVVAFATGRPAEGKPRPVTALQCRPVVLAGTLTNVAAAEVSLTVRNANVFGRGLVGKQVRVQRTAGTRVAGATLAVGAPAIVQARSCQRGLAQPVLGAAGSILVPGQQVTPAPTGTVVTPEHGSDAVE
jgi:hypothetical protein